MKSLGGKWGLFRHYWVIVKLAINLVATVVLLLYMQTLSYLARPATEPSPARALAESSMRGPLLLVLGHELSVYKPAGMTRYGQRKQRQRPGPRAL